MTPELEVFSATCQNRIAQLVETYLAAKPTVAPALKEAMFYAMNNGGKRVRPLCVYAIGALLQAPWEALDVPAFAIELIHGFSLIHDDLPAMDNADLRRGKPSCHKMFGEAMAVLAGDALQTLAFEVIATHPAPLNHEKRIAMVQVLSHYSGLNGMTGGQALDMAGVDSLDGLTQMYSLKTGALGSACVEMALLAADTVSAGSRLALTQFMSSIGLAFQIQDDLLDETGTVDIIGKPPGLDGANKKLTYPVLVGLPAAEAKVEALFAEGLAAIEPFGASADLLRSFAKNLLQRSK